MQASAGLPVERFLADVHDRAPGGSTLAFAGLPAQATAWLTGMYDLHLLSVDDWGAVEADFHARPMPLLDASGRAAFAVATTLIDATPAP